MPNTSIVARAFYLAEFYQPKVERFVGYGPHLRAAPASQADELFAMIVAVKDHNPREDSNLVSRFGTAIGVAVVVVIPLLLWLGTKLGWEPPKFILDALTALGIE